MTSQALTTAPRRHSDGDAGASKWTARRVFSAKKSLDELRKDLAEVERMIRVLEWVALRPSASRG
jgi:hypothetical protein